MLPHLILFYKECIAPEIVRNNLGRGLRCEDLPYIKKAIELQQEKRNREEELKR